MQKHSRRVLKPSQVKVEGKYHLEPGPVGPGAGEAESVPCQARVVETQGEYAVIEFVCSCGVRSYIRCDYARQAAADEEAASQQA